MLPGNRERFFLPGPADFIKRASDDILTQFFSICRWPASYSPGEMVFKHGLRVQEELGGLLSRNRYSVGFALVFQ